MSLIKLGRIPGERWGPRAIDIDLLFVGDLQMETALLTLPHCEMFNRSFVLAPLAEIAGKLIHPVSLKSIDQMLAECPDPLPVNKKNM